jgi:hypothetical protein
VTWERLPVRDEYDEGGRRAVYVDDQVAVVSELAVTILDALPADHERIAQVLVDTYGPPPGDLSQAVTAALGELAELGLVVHASSTDG